MVGCIIHKMGTEEVLRKIKSHEGVRGAFVIDDSVRTMIETEESGIRTSGGFVYENLGMDRSRGMDTQVCVFSDGFITNPDSPMIVMMDEAGDIYGHNVPKNRGLSSAAVRNGAVWMADDFVIYPDRIPKSEPRFVVLPHPVDFLDLETTSYNPAFSTDRLLKQRFGFGGRGDLTTTIVAFNSGAQTF